MFICAITGAQSKPGEAALKLVTHIRNKTYTRYNHKSDQDEVAGSGTEIVREVMVSREAYDKAIAGGFQPEIVKDGQ